MTKKKEYTVPVRFSVPQTIFLGGGFTVEASSPEEAKAKIQEIIQNKDEETIRKCLSCDDYDWEFDMGQVKRAVERGEVQNLDLDGEPEEE